MEELADYQKQQMNRSAENLKSDHPVHNGGYCNLENSLEDDVGTDNILDEL